MPQLETERLEEWTELRGIWRKDPSLYARQRLGLNPTHQQEKLFEAIAPDGAKVSARAGHGVGKSGAVSSIVWWFLECFDFPKIPCTAPSASQLRDILWAEVTKWARKSDAVSLAQGLPRELWLSNLFSITQDRIADRGSPAEWFAAARTSRKENPDALQGFHASDIEIAADGKSAVHNEAGGGGKIMFVVEEASGVPDEIFEVAEGAMSSHGARALLVGNPTRNTGAFARSHKQDRSLWTTLHFRCADSPLVDEEYRPRLVRKFGEGSNVVRVRADGDFPKQDDDVLISLEAAEAAISRPAPKPSSAKKRLGIDVARFGDDRTCFVLRVGSHVPFIGVRAKKDTMETVGEAVKLANELDVDEIYVDVIGIGAGVVDRLREHRRNGVIRADVIEVNVASAAPEQRKTKVDTQGYKLRDHLWLELRDWTHDEEPSFEGCERDHAEDLAGELASPKYAMDSSGRLVVESKDKMKDRGLRSPDIADALAATFAPPRARATVKPLSM